MSIRDHKIITIDVKMRGLTEIESYTGLFPSEEYAKLWVNNYLKTVENYEILAIRSVTPIACIIAHNW